tara:strand:- start:1540 stop:1917 length:378 start_codon:yes stop_codon:yes gene_type:complete
VYNINIKELNMSRKRRNDRNQVIYLLTCGVTGERYVGLTVARGRAYKRSMNIRFEAHVRNATVYGKDTLLYRAMRTHGPATFQKEVLEVVRGKAEAHRRELEIGRELGVELNMEGFGRKTNSVGI